MNRLLPLLVLLAPAVAFAGTGSVEGTLVDQSTGKVITGQVSIACGAVRKSAQTDGAGHFAIRGLPEGACKLTAAGGGFVTISLAVTITSDSISTLLVSVTSRAEAERMRKEEARMRAEQERWAKQRGRRMKMDFAAGDVMLDAGGGGGRPEPARGGAVRGAPGVARPAPMAPPPPPAPMPMRAPRPEPKVARNAAGNMKAQQQSPVVAAKIVVLDDANRKREEAQRRVQRKHNADKRKIAERIAAQQNDGWAVVRVFPVPQYPKRYDGPRDDFRETVYWNPTVETDARGNAVVSFVTSDAVTSFKATAEGFSSAGAVGGGAASIQSKLPLTLDAKLPVEVTSGDVVRLPVTLANETDEPLDATLNAAFGSAFKIAGESPNTRLRLAAKARQTVVFALNVVATDGTADIELAVAARGLEDKLKRTMRVVPRGFPIEASASGTAKTGTPSRHVLDLQGAMPGSIKATVTMFPSPVAAIATGMDGMIREPGGCFEQASSTNYPNIMILGYLESTSGGGDPALVQKTKGVLDKGYKLLTGYETKERGYEWFGQTPGHEALTAYGLMEFADMAKVYDVDRKMVDRTADWLMSRRDGQGGFQRSAQALDSFGRAGPATTNAYIMWALAEAKRTSTLTRELAVQKTLGGETRDPYLLALATNTSLLAGAKADGTAMAKRLVALQQKDGSWTGAKETITMSGGQSLAIESTALAVLALIKASPNSEYEPQIRAGVEWLNTKRGGYGAWGNTQATILGLKALTAYAEHARQMAVGGTATLVVNGKPAGSIKFEKGRRDKIVWDDLATKLAPGKNTIELRLDGGATLPYTIAIEYRSPQPPTSPAAKVAVSTELLKTAAKMGDGVTLRAHVENKTATGIPMTLARIGLPGGTVFQTWQLKELRDKGLIDFYETRPREVILYWRALPPNAKKDVDLNLLAAVPGSYEAPASSTYLYYTAEDKAWSKPVSITIDR